MITIKQDSKNRMIAVAVYTVGIIKNEVEMKGWKTSGAACPLIQKSEGMSRPVGNVLSRTK